MKKERKELSTRRHLLFRIAVLILCISFTASMLAGCGSTGGTNASTSNASSSTQAATQAQAKETSSAGGLTLPIVDKPITLKYWVPLDTQAKTIIQNYNECLAYQEFEKRTGIKIEFLHPPVGQEVEQYKLLISSNDLPDIFEEWGQAVYPGGGDKAIADGAYIKLNDLIDKYAPNFKALRASNQMIAKQTITDDGNIWGFPMIQDFESLVWSGMVVRKDYLEKFNLTMPTTISEWYNVLTAFKKNGIEAPLLFPSTGMDNYHAIIGAYGIGAGFYKEGDAVKYGPYEPAFKDYLTEMNKWYSEGLIDKDFATRDQKMIDSMAISGKAGAWIGTSGVGIERYIAAAKKDGSSYELEGTSYPSLKQGEKPKLRQKDWKNRGFTGSITTACKYPEAAVKWFDYHYSKEGALLLNYGLENVSFKYDNNQPMLIRDELISSKPEYAGMSYSVVMWKYRMNNAPFLRLDTSPLSSLIPESQQARTLWGESATYDDVLPPLTLTPDEATEYNTIMNEINTYSSQMRLKFIIGTTPISEFDNYLAQLKKLGMDRAVEIQQNAYNRYLKR